MGNVVVSAQMHEQPSGVVTAQGAPACWYYGNPLALVSNGNNALNRFTGWTTPVSPPPNCWTADQIVSFRESVTILVLEAYIASCTDAAGFSTKLSWYGIAFPTSIVTTDTWELRTGYESPSTANASFCYLTQQPGSSSVVRIVFTLNAPHVYPGTFAAFNFYLFGTPCLAGLLTYPDAAALFVPSAAGVLQAARTNLPVPSFGATTYALADPSTGPWSGWTAQTPLEDPSTAWNQAILGTKLTTAFTWTTAFAGAVLGFGIYFAVGELPDEEETTIFATELTLTLGEEALSVSWEQTQMVESPRGLEWTAVPAEISPFTMSITLHTRTPSTVLYVSGVAKITTPPLGDFVAQVGNTPIRMQAIKLTTDPLGPAGPPFAPAALAPTDVTVTEVSCTEFTVAWTADAETAAQVVTWTLQRVLGNTTPTLTVPGAARSATVTASASNPFAVANKRCQPKPQYVVYGTLEDGRRTPTSNPSVFAPPAADPCCQGRRVLAGRS